MKKHLLVVLLGISVFLGLAGCASLISTAIPPSVGQKEVALTLSAADEQTQNLQKLCKVWGFVKYTHRAFVSGETDWDAELLSLIPIVSAADGEDVNDILYDWFIGLGDDGYELTGNPKLWSYTDGDDKLDLRDWAWLADTSYLGGPLSEALSRFKEITGRYSSGPGNLINEKRYESMDYGDSGYRLLGLFRLWNAMEYFSPYMNILDDDWDGLLLEYIPKILEGTDKQSYLEVIHLLSTKLHDVHVMCTTSFISTKYGGYGAPAWLIEAEGRLVVYAVDEKYADTCPLMPGDVLVSIDGVSIEDIVENAKPYLPAPNDEKLLAVLAGRWSGVLLSSLNETMEIVVLRDGVELTLAVEKQNWRVNDFFTTPYIIDKSHEILENNIGVIHPESMNYGDVKRAMEDLADTDAIIIDLRQDIGYIMFAEDIVKYFVNEYTPFAVQAASADLIPGVYTKSVRYTGGTTNSDAYFYDKPVVVLMDEQTLSGMEYTVMLLRVGPNVTVMGQNSVGADGGVKILPMPGGFTVIFTGTAVFTPDGGQTQRIGLSPDIYVERTIEGVKEGRDDVMEAAVRYLLDNRE